MMQVKNGLFCCTVLMFFCFLSNMAIAQTTLQGQVTDQYEKEITGATLKAIPSGVSAVTDSLGNFTIAAAANDSIQVSKDGYATTTVKADTGQPVIIIEKHFGWKDLLNPLFYIKNGGLWLLLFIVFAETGLMVGFFLPGDSLLFVAGIYCSKLIATLPTGSTGSGFIDLVILWILLSICGILGNIAGYWFGKKSGPFLYTRKDTFFFKRKHLLSAKEFYDKHGGQAIVFARFLPIVRTFAPIVAGVVQMDRKKFMYYNIIGCVAWVASMLLAGHYLDKLFLQKFNFDLKKHLEVIVIGIVLITTLPVIYKLFFGKRSTQETPPSENL
ncbi:MAG: VTT domain-containing protein [Chitinophagaceae bacterium]